MREIHQGLPMKDFVRPSTGIIDVTVCSKSGLLKTPGCPGDVTMPFLEGTQPTRYCDQHDSAAARESQQLLQEMRFDTMLIDSNTLLGELKMPELRLDLLPPETRRQESPASALADKLPAGSASRNNSTSRRRTANTGASTRTTPAAPTAPAPDTQPPPAQPRSQTPTRNTRGNPVISDEEFALELPDYNPLLD
jgi:penicillin-binding protein 1A